MQEIVSFKSTLDKKPTNFPDANDSLGFGTNFHQLFELGARFKLDSFLPNLSADAALGVKNTEATYYSDQDSLQVDYLQAFGFSGYVNYNFAELIGSDILSASFGVRLFGTPATSGFLHYYGASVGLGAKLNKHIELKIAHAFGNQVFIQDVDVLNIGNYTDSHVVFYRKDGGVEAGVSYAF
ncbi:MAG: hypothetical protein E7K04_02630 [Helicobacter sp.]|mgnify:CR=1 FL=1|nr:hypothetical protein [Helicobacter sp.]